VPRRSFKSQSKAPPAEPAYEAGIRLIARRAHSRAELRRKLVRRGYAASDVEAAEQRLLAAGYLGDGAFARGYVRRRSQSLGPLAISAELAARGVERDLADGAMKSLQPADQLDAATRVARRLAGDARFASYRELLHSVGAKLLRRGFSMEIARAACQGVWDGTPEEAGA